MGSQSLVIYPLETFLTKPIDFGRLGLIAAPPAGRPVRFSTRIAPGRYFLIMPYFIQKKRLTSANTKKATATLFRERLINDGIKE